MSERNGAIKLQIWQWCLTWPKYFRWPFRNFGSFHWTELMQTEAGLSACFMHDATPQLMSWEGHFRVFGSSGFFICASCFWSYVMRLSCYCVYNSLHYLRLDFGEMNRIQSVIWELLCWMKLIYRGLEWLAWGLGPQNTHLSTTLLANRFHVRSFRAHRET